MTFANRYHILTPLAEGGMGATYRAWDSVDKRLVVIKTPKKPRIDHDGQEWAACISRFRREFDAMQLVRHDHIVPVVGSGDHDGLPFIAMRLLPGGSLADRRRKVADSRYHPIAPSQLHEWLPGVASALDAIHTHGMIHRDVKPTNIFFDAFGHAFLGDFGIAKATDTAGAKTGQTLTATNMSIGTPEYMAPELINQSVNLTGQVDQYALAVTVYELVSGCRPFTGKMGYHIITEHQCLPVPPLDGRELQLPESLIHAVERGLAKKPEDRFPTCGDFAAAVLRDVARSSEAAGIARLLCPNPECHTLVKVPISEGGKRGLCPACSARVEIDEKFTNFWLQSERESIQQKGPGKKPGESFFETDDVDVLLRQPDFVGEVDTEFEDHPQRPRNLLGISQFFATFKTLGVVCRRHLFSLVMFLVGCLVGFVAGFFTGRNTYAEPNNKRPTAAHESKPGFDPIVAEWDWSVAGVDGEARKEFLRDGGIRNCAGGWWRRATEDGERVFYVICWPIHKDQLPFVDVLEMSKDHTTLEGVNQNRTEIVGVRGKSP